MIFSPATFFVFGLATLMAMPSSATNSWHDGTGPDAPWFTGAGENIDNITKIKQCLNKHRDATICRELELDGSNVANWGSAAAMHTKEWSHLGQEYVDVLIKKYPDKAAGLNKAQTAWYTYVSNQCEFMSSIATYDDDDAAGNHPAFYDWVTNISCIYGHTMDRVVELRSLSTD